jgi:5-formyltetrahydrofolate cyclo-ligase
MDNTMSQTTWKEVLERLRRRYRKAGREHKRKLLDQAQELLGYHRKSEVRALGAPVHSSPTTDRVLQAWQARHTLDL